MKKTILNPKGIVALILALVMALSLAACGTSGTGTGLPVIGDVGTLPDNDGLPRGNGGVTSGLPRGNANRKRADPETELKKYGDIETLVRSVKTPARPGTDNAGMSNSYGAVDWSTAAQGYITFTAKGQERVFILQGPNDAKAIMTAATGDTIKVALTDGTGKYQYAIGNNNPNSESYRVQYKNSFDVKAIDAGLAPYLVSTPWGDYEKAPNATAKAKELWDGSKTQLENVKALAKWVDGLKYDKKLMIGTIDLYVNPDKVIENGGGVCNEMSKLLVAMLRSQGVPAYYQSGVNSVGGNHAWVRAWVELSSSTKGGITTSEGAWVNIEAVDGNIVYKSAYGNNYSTETNNYAN